MIEADESDRSFLKLRRDVAVVTNIELDHHATYGSLAELEEAFAEFDRRRRTRSWTPAPGTSVRTAWSWSTRHLPPAVHGSWRRLEIELQVPGEHNVLNALAALAALRAAGVEPAEAAPGAREVHRRRAALRVARPHGERRRGLRRLRPSPHRGARHARGGAARSRPRRLVAAFQPHLYSRTRMLAREFGEALALADLVVVARRLPARASDPEDFPGVTGYLVAEAAADAAGGRPVWWMPAVDDAEPQLRAELTEGDVLVTLGAGNVDELAKRLTA